MPEHSTSKVVGPELAMEELGCSPDVLRALKCSGLLGYTPRGITRAGLDSFMLYGTQWGDDARPFAEQLLLQASQDEIVGAHQVIFISTSPEEPPPTQGWIAQFYLRANPFFFLRDGTIVPRGQSAIRLGVARAVAGARLPAYLYPDPDGNLALLSVIGDTQGDASDPYHAAFDIAGPILDEMSFASNHPLPIVQAILIGIPSGVVSLSVTKPAPAFDLTDVQVAPRCPVPALQAATSLFREGASSSDVFHQFLSFWRSYESATEARAGWRVSSGRSRQDRRGDVVLIAETMPSTFAVGDFAGLSFGTIKERLRASHRNPIAHGTTEAGAPKTPASAEDVSAVLNHLGIIRYMARVTLLNARATLTNTER